MPKAMPASIATECPSRETLVDYASGTLAESAAETLSEHLEGCQACQRRVDELMGRGDSLMGALRSVPDPKEATRQFDNADELISKAKKLAPVIGSGTSINAQGNTAQRIEQRPKPEINSSISAFLATLARSKLMSREEVDALAAGNLPQDAKELAKELVTAKKLTSFQANAVLRGVSRGLVLGNYIILDKLGKGGMGNVYKARHMTMGRIVCIKTLPSAATKDPELLERFRREARAVAALNHPNIVVGHDAADCDGIHYLVMEFIEGSDLAKRAKERAFPISEAIGITLQAAKALAYAHRQGVIHRDIKPHNLLVDEAGNVKILDMGIARFDSFLGDTGDGSNQATMTNTGVVMGTVDFMSPEQALNTRKADARSDVYSLGCTLYYILTCQPLFGGETVMEKLVAHRETPAPRLADSVKNVPPGLEAVFQKMVAKEPRDRYSNMNAVAADLAAVQAGQKPKAQSGKARKFLKSHPTAIAVISAVALIALALILPGMLNEPVSDPNHSLSANEPTDPSEGERPDEETGSGDQANPPSDDAGRIVNDGERPRGTITAAGSVLNGRGGRFLVIVPPSYQIASLDPVQDELEARDAEIVVLSTRSGWIQGDDGSGSVKVDATFEEFEFDVDDFDGVIFAGGIRNIPRDDSRSFSTPDGQLMPILREFLSKPRVVAFLGDALPLIGRPDLRGFATVIRGDGYELRTDPNRPSSIFKLDDAQQASQMVAQMYLQLGRQHLKAEGGEGRVLLVAPQSGCNVESFRHMRDALETRLIEVDVAAEQEGSAQPTPGSSESERPIPVDLALHNVKAGDYDAVIFCDGEHFGSQTNPRECQQNTCNLVADMMAGSSVIAGIGSGWTQLVDDFNARNECLPEESRGEFRVLAPKDGREGHAAGSEEAISTREDADAFVALVFDDLLK